jgi:hypothetical protein
LTAQNPFEIIDRLEQQGMVDITEEVTVTEAPTATPEITSSAPTVDTNNPFEIVARNGQRPVTRATARPTQEVVAPKTPTIIAPKTPSITRQKSDFEDGTSTFILLLLTLIPTTILFTIFRSYLKKAIENFGQSGVLTRSYREYAGASIAPMNSWFVLFFINSGLFIALVLRHYGYLLADTLLMHVAICIGAVSAFILVKRAFLALLGVLFPIQKQIQLYLYLLMVFSILVGVFLTFANISLLYILDSGVNVLIISSFGVLVLFYIVRAYRGLLVVNRLALLHVFHFLLYICAVEIAPIFVLIKLVMLYGK